MSNLLNDLGSTIKGQSFTRFENKHKSYMEHAKHRLYQPENVAGHPGPGQYTTTSWLASQNLKVTPLDPLYKDLIRLKGN